MMKSIRSKIAAILLTIIVFLSLSFGLVNSFLNLKTSGAVLQSSMTETASVTADRIHQELTAYTERIYDVGSTAVLADDAVPAEQKKAMLSQRASAYGFQQGNMVNSSGTGLDGTSYSGKAYVSAALKGETYCSFAEGDTGAIVIAAPVWENGIPKSKVKGAVYFISKDTFLSDLVSTIQVGKTGTVYLLNQGGMVIAHPKADQVGGKSTGDLAQIESKMVSGAAGYGTYQQDGASKVIGYAPLPGESGWSVGVAADRSEYMQAGFDAIFWIALLTIIYCVLGVFVSFFVGSAIAKPIASCADRLFALSSGDLTSPVPVIKTKDETAVLAHATEIIVTNLRAMVGDLSHLLQQLSQSNLNVESQAKDAYQGDYLPLSQNVERIVDSLNDTILKISQSASMVSSEAEQVSSGSQLLAQGATEQTASIEELAASIAHLSDKVKENALNAVQAGGWATQTMEEVGQCNDQMQKMVAAMKRIDQTSAQISNIVKTIEDIAFQTNILALNAAVEASRAGTAGKGFAVVADEVRNLASKSAESAKNTSTLIAESLSAVAEGSKMVSNSLEALQAVTKSMAETQREHREIAEVTEEQAAAVDQLTAVMDQISGVVQTNTATAEESAASSEELSGQAQVMKSLVDQFHLRSSGTSSKQPGKW